MSDDAGFVAGILTKKAVVKAKLMAHLEKAIVAAKSVREARKAKLKTWRRSKAAVVISEPVVLLEHTRVKALREIEEHGERVPAGATGTIVHVIKGGVGYDVEFTAPKHVIISAARDELAVA